MTQTSFYLPFSPNGLSHEHTPLSRKYNLLPRKSYRRLLLRWVRVVPHRRGRLQHSVQSCQSSCQGHRWNSSWHRCPLGRRWNAQQKAFALSLMHSIPKTYRLLRNVFALPTPRLLRRTTKRSRFIWRQGKVGREKGRLSNNR